jgi:hypothetical protein
VKTYPAFSALALLVMLLVGCSGGSTEDPSKVYDELVKAAGKKDYGVLYDRLDTKMRQNVNNLIDLSFKTRDSMAPQERAFWDSVGKKSPREAFVAIMSSDPQMTANLSPDYKVLSADTMVVLTIQRTGRAPELRYFQVEGNRLLVSDPPAPPMSDMPAGHPDVGPDAMPQTPPHGMPNAAPGGGTGSDPHGDSTGR